MYLSTSSIFFSSTITSLLTCLLRITLVFPRCILRPTGLLMSWIFWNIPYSFDVDLAMSTISAKIRWDKYLPSTLMPLFSQFIMLIMAYCRHGVKSLGKMLSLSGSFSTLKFFFPVLIVVELMLPHYRGYAGCSSTPWFFCSSKSG